MSERNVVGRRNVLKTVGGITAASVVGGTATTPALAAHNEGGTPVRVNQVGYPTEANKRAIVTSATADVSGLSSFEVVDADSGETVSSGSLSEAATDGLTGKSTNHSIKWADFSDLSSSGTYKVVVGEHESHPFAIGEPGDVYGDLLADVGRLYTLKRANTHIQDPETGLDIGPGHMQDEEAVIREPETSDFLEDYSAGDTIDVTGGWYDAGDYGKYVLTHAVTAAQLMLAYERNPDAFSVGQFDIPDSVDDPNVGEMPDVLAEVKYGLQFLSKMQRPDGALFFKVALAGPDPVSFPPMDAAPTDVDGTRYVLGLSSAGTAMGVGAFAMAARVFGEYGDEQFANTMQEQAEAGFEWLQNNPDLVWEKSRHQDSASGAYGRGPLSGSEAQEDAPERYWAAAELLRTTGDSTYDDYIQNDLPMYGSYNGPVSIPDSETGYRSPVDWDNTLSLGHYAYANTDGASASTAESIVAGAAWNSTRISNGTDPYGTGVYDFYWGWVKSGVSRATQMMWAEDMGSSVPYGFSPLHYALGRSAVGYSFVTGYGENSTENPHDRIIQSQNMEEPIPGMLVSGPHANLWDDNGDVQYSGPLANHVSKDTPHQMSYIDDHASYVVNEWAINYTAPLFLALSETGITASDEGPNPPELTEPANLSVTSTSSSSVTVSWDGVSAAEEYQISVDGEDGQTVGAGTTTATVEDLDADTTYTIGVAAVSGSDAAQSTVEATTDPSGGDGPQVAVDLSTNQVGQDGTATASVTLSAAPTGLSGYNLTVSVADTSVATITGGSIPDSLMAPGSEPAPSEDGSSIVLTAADLSENIGEGATDVDLGSVTVKAQSEGETDVAVAVENVDNDGGNDIPVAVMDATLTVGGDSLSSVEGTVPQDVDGDGLHMDLNANGRVDYDDVVVYFNNKGDGAITDHVEAYDYNGNHEIDFDDVVSLFTEAK